MITIHDVEQGSPEWHELHTDLWSGSTALKLLRNKPLPDWGSWLGNKWTKRGKLLESIAIREFEVTQKAPGGVMSVGFVTNSKYPNAGYSPDGIFGDTLLEVKCFNGKRHESLADGNITVEILAQIHFGMLICGLKKAKLLVFNPEYVNQLTVIDIKYDKSIEANIKFRLRPDLLSRV